MPGTLGVPGSKRSGRYGGCSSESEALPVPPVTTGVSCAAKAGSSTSTPMPDGPSSPLCPGADRADRPRARKSMGRWPAVWAASRQKATPRRRQISPTAAASCTVPETLEPWARTTSRVSGRSSGSTADTSSRPAPSQGIRSKVTPAAARSCSGRMTALCSMADTRQWSPGRRKPRSTRFSPQVLPGVRITRVGSSVPNRRQIRCRSRRATAPASWAAP